MKCKFFRIDTSSCLRTVVTTIMSRERGLINLCQRHLVDQQKRDKTLVKATWGKE